MTNKEWFRQAGFGMMVHFGLYSLIGGEWKGRRLRRAGAELRLHELDKRLGFPGQRPQGLCAPV